jgi:hypothetical protein
VNAASRRLLDRLEAAGRRILAARRLWRWVGYGLTAAALLYAGLILALGWQQLRAVSLRAYLPAAGLTLGLHLASFLIQLGVWLRLMALRHRAGWRDVEIYSRMVLVRSLPGGIWHWVGRTALYRAATELPSQVIVVSSLVEWGLLLVVGLGLHLATQAVRVPILLLAAGLVLAGAWLGAARWQPAARPFARRLLESGAWMLGYLVAWVLGGIIVWLFVRASGSATLNVVTATGIWTLTGGLGLLTNLVPLGFGVREVTLTLLLQGHVAPAVGLWISLLIRLLFTLADTAWALLGWGWSVLMLRRAGRAGLVEAVGPENQARSAAGQEGDPR